MIHETQHHRRPRTCGCAVDGADAAARTDGAGPTSVDRVLRATGDFAQDLSHHTGVDEVLATCVSLLPRVVPGADHITLTSSAGAAGSDDAAVAATTDPTAAVTLLLQYELREGLAIDALRSGLPIVSNDLQQESRWPRWLPRLTSTTALRSMLTITVCPGRSPTYVLTLASDRCDVYRQVSVQAAEAAAAHLTVAVETASTIHHRGVAMETRTAIGRAEGMVMERLGLSADQAHCYLQRVSQQSNRKLAELADELVRTGLLPDASARGDLGQYPTDRSHG
ncbi:MAG TPA: GAF and ANTAR domain-containing protein [Bacillota bacterium]|nr:GAF and ANTAR domain-containing protein [Bacillota bacterium]